MASGIRKIICGLRRDFYARFSVTMLKAFVDDSGSGGDSPWYVLAGYIGTVEGWDTFDEPWRAILDSHPKIEYFKSSQAESLRPDGQWAGVTKDERNQKINALIEVITKCAKRAIHVRMQQRDYEEVIRGYVPPEWDNPYYFLFPSFVSAVITMEKYFGLSKSVEFVFDSSETFEEPSLQLYGQFKGFDKFAGRVVNIHYEDEKLFLPLQAADLVAWQVRRRLCSTSEEKRAHFERCLYRLPENPYSFILTRDRLQLLGEAMDRKGKDDWAKLGQPENMRPWKR
jgi:hypothetical protein